MSDKENIIPLPELPVINGEDLIIGLLTASARIINRKDAEIRAAIPVEAELEKLRRDASEKAQYESWWHSNYKENAELKKKVKFLQTFILGAGLTIPEEQK